MILSKEKAKSFSYKKTNVPYIIISITDIDSENVFFAKNPFLISVLRLKFNDVDKDEEGAITEEDAMHIAEFVKRYKDYAGLIVVHCEAGMSRSSGVCAALMKWLCNDDSYVFDNSFYRPNMKCYRRVLNAISEYFMEDSDYE